MRKNENNLEELWRLIILLRSLVNFLISFEVISSAFSFLFPVRIEADGLKSV